MRGLLIFATALLVSAPSIAQPAAPMLPSAETRVREAADALFRALRDEDKTQLADRMVETGMIFVHNQMDPMNPRVDVIPVTDHLARWEKGTRKVDEIMLYDIVLVERDMAQVWGPYTFWVGEMITHCGYNSMSMVQTDDGWKVANTSFTMVPPDQCKEIGAPAAPEE